MATSAETTDGLICLAYKKTTTIKSSNNIKLFYWTLIFRSLKTR